MMIGFAGLLSLGHALYVGIGAYASAALFVHFGIAPWIGVFAAIVLSRARWAALIGYLGFRFAIGGVYFALLTIAFAEFARIWSITPLARRYRGLVPAGRSTATRVDLSICAARR